MTTLTDLRDLLDERADEVGHASLIGEVVVTRGHRVRTRRRLTAGATLVAVAALGLSLVILPNLSGSDVAPSSPGGEDHAQTGPTWAPNIDGIDLPVGPALTTAYAVGNKIVDGAKTFSLPGDVTALLEVPEGFVVTLRDVSRIRDIAESSAAIAVVSPEGDVNFLDTGTVSGFAATSVAGQTLVAWSAEDPDTPDVYTVKRTILGAIEPETGLVVAEKSTVVGFEGIEPIVMQLGDGGGATFRWDTQAPALVPTTWRQPEGVSPDGATAYYFDDDTQCMYAASLNAPTDKIWENCDQSHRPPSTLSPDGNWLAYTSVYSAKTGQYVRELDIGVSFDLADMGRGAFYSAMELGWESDTSLVLQVGINPVSGRGGSYVDVRCDVTTGVCERVPSDVDFVPSTLVATPPTYG